MSFRRRPFPEVLDNLLTNITGGVSAETHPFPAPDENNPYEHILQQPPVAEVQSVYGQRDGETVLFRLGSDYRLEGGNKLIWETGAQLPDEGTLLTINYYPQASLPVLTDVYTGSVVRTITESMALEISRLYAQLEQVYDAGFINTATDSALDNVVALLGIDRVQGGYAAGTLEFIRAENTAGAINIPTGTRVINADGSVEYETTETVQMAPSQTLIRVNARDIEPNDPVPADTLTTMVVPLAGIGGVRNPAPTAIATQSETDTELRSRAKNFLYGSQTATIGALQQAVARQNITAEITEIKDTALGCYRVEIAPQVDSLSAEQEQRLREAIRDVRPVGVEVTLVAVKPPIKLDVKLQLFTAPDLLEQDLRRIQRSLKTELEDYFLKLPADKPGSINQIIGKALAINGLEDISIVDIVRGDNNESVLIDGELATTDLVVRLGALDIADPNLPTQITVTLTQPNDGAPISLQEVEASVSKLLTAVNADSAKADSQVLTYSKLKDSITFPEGANADDYQIQFIATQASQLSYILSDTEAAYPVTALERLSLNSVEQAASDEEEDNA